MPRSIAGASGGNAACAIQANCRRHANLAGSAVVARAEQQHARRSDPLRARPLERPQRVPARWARGTRYQSGGTRDPPRCTWAEESSVRRQRWRRRALGDPVLADRDLQTERRRAIRLSARCAHSNGRRAPDQPPGRTAALAVATSKCRQDISACAITGRLRSGVSVRSRTSVRWCTGERYRVPSRIGGSPMGARYFEHKARRAWWATHLEAWRRSGVTRTEYCRLQRLTKITLDRWHNALNTEESALEQGR